ncbi:MAG: copper resistance protein CopC/CopD, partial [Anaerolinea sp.]|nr:copper resistance protein CopC/CopD [Anaerolinea sp.]
MVFFIRKLQLFLLVLLLFAFSGSVSAHSNLYRADPPPNAELTVAPELIHLYFTEALEPEFSGITLLREDGTTVETPPATVENFTEMTLVPGDLPDGLYTVSWRALSSVDGHQTRGIYAFAIGQAAGAALADSQAESIPPQDAAARWLTHISTALLVGGLGFLLFVWQPSKVARRLADATVVSRRMSALILAGWLLYGVVTALSLLVYTGEAAALSDIGRVISGTRFGAIWLIRLGLWLVTGIVLWIARGQPVAYIPALLISAALLYAQSQYSHSSATHDAEQTVLADWLHLLGTALWLGGLMHFFAVIPLIRGVSGALATLIGWFSNMARAALLALIATGAFLGFLFVGTPQALLTTLYGHALLVKLILIIPLVAIAGVNLILMARRLRRGTGAGWLRGLIGAEVALIGGVLIGAAVMTA